MIDYVTVDIRPLPGNTYSCTLMQNAEDSKKSMSLCPGLMILNLLFCTSGFGQDKLGFTCSSALQISKTFKTFDKILIFCTRKNNYEGVDFSIASVNLAPEATADSILLLFHILRKRRNMIGFHMGENNKRRCFHILHVDLG